MTLPGKTQLKSFFSDYCFLYKDTQQKEHYVKIKPKTLNINATLKIETMVKILDDETGKVLQVEPHIVHYRDLLPKNNNIIVLDRLSLHVLCIKAFTK